MSKFATNDIWAYTVENDGKVFYGHSKDKPIRIISYEKCQEGYIVNGIGPRNIRVVSNGILLETKPVQMRVLLIPRNENDPMEQNTYFITSNINLIFSENPKTEIESPSTPELMDH